MMETTTQTSPQTAVNDYKDERILFFDGVCVLCNKSVNRTIKLDKKGIFKHAALQGATADKLLGGMTMEQRLQGLIVYDRGDLYQGHEAIARIGGLLYPWLAWGSTVIRWFPFRQIMALIYRLIARNRYNWFGEMESCALPAPEVRDRYILD